MLASGGNDNLFFVWDVRKGHQIVKSAAHRAAVKALAWNPHRQNQVLSGGGTNDQTLKIWNVSTGKLEHDINTES